MLVNRLVLAPWWVPRVDQVYNRSSSRWFRKCNDCRSRRTAEIRWKRWVVLSSCILAQLDTTLSALPMFLAEEKERATTRYLNITTIATFFSSVTATALQTSLAINPGSTVWDVVNLFWFISLVFSVSSGVSSLLGMTWRKSKMWVDRLCSVSMWMLTTLE